jgi:aspartyl-tRNA(Asn)/glutamyl-tRNA(Gln) amidotransferase subunit B
MPGILPVLNRHAVELAIRTALALDCKISKRERFARKGYFYPDLPKGFQISQYEEPFATEGQIPIEQNGKSKTIRIKRMNLEEDAGKLIHDEIEESLVDFNRCGVPLLEIVSEPDIKSPREAHFYLTHLRQVLQYLGVCSGDMEKGHLRCEPNISLKQKREAEMGTRTELKNLNSLRAVERGLNFEIERQKKLLDSGKKVLQETLLWDEKNEIALPMRGKEEAEDYRYFPEPDLVPLVVKNEWIERVKKDLPELPHDRKMRFLESYNIRESESRILTQKQSLADYFEETVKIHPDPTLVSRWITTEVLGILNEKKIEIEEFSVTPSKLSELFQLIQKGTISKKMAKDIFTKMVESGKKASDLAKESGEQIQDEEALLRTIEEILSKSQKEVMRYRNGESKLLGYFIGEVMKKTDGRANPRMVNELIKKKLQDEPKPS